MACWLGLVDEQASTEGLKAKYSDRVAHQSQSKCQPIIVQTLAVNCLMLKADSHVLT
jgi:hypothetical protein